MDQAKSAKSLFKIAKAGIPSGTAIAESAMKDLLGGHLGNREYIKQNFSKLVSDVQLHAYTLYLTYEAKECGSAIRTVFSEYLPPSASANDLFELIENNFPVLDRFYLSLTQSRRTRAGSAFESIVSALFKALGYPYTPQPDLGESHPDYVLPSIDWYKKYASDCIIFTCKRTLRERWRQVVTEGATGQSFFLATIDEKLSSAELDRMKQRRVIVVVPALLKANTYLEGLNVISFEDFFLHHLDAAMARWKAAGALDASS
jgi:hypothetical protein